MEKPSSEDARLRMQARSKLSRPGQPPHMRMVVFDPPKRDAQNKIIGEAQECDSWRASVTGGDGTGQRYERRPDESLEQFKTRVSEDLSVNQKRYVVYWPSDTAPATAPGTSTNA
jgi:hypothetical protein